MSGTSRTDGPPKRQGASSRSLLIFGCIVTGAFIILGIFGPYITPHDPFSTDLSVRLQSPSSEFWFGTDRFGRDILSRILAGARVSLLVAVSVAVVSFLLGSLIGAVGGYLGGWTDRSVQFVINTLLAFPGFLLALTIVAMWGGSLRNVIVALVVAYTPRVAMVMRGVAVSISARPYVEAAQVLGIRRWKILFRHVLPNSIGPVIIVATVSAAFAILAEAALSFLGLGVQPPAASWGNIIAEGRSFLFTHPWITLAPGTCIALVVTGLNVVGEALRDALDPSLRESPI